MSSTARMATPLITPAGLRLVALVSLTPRIQALHGLLLDPAVDVGQREPPSTADLEGGDCLAAGEDGFGDCG
jgi:hypothetical protein